MVRRLSKRLLPHLVLVQPANKVVASYKEEKELLQGRLVLASVLLSVGQHLFCVVKGKDTIQSEAPPHGQRRYSRRGGGVSVPRHWVPRKIGG